jgi:serine/threonine-protein kinase
VLNTAAPPADGPHTPSGELDVATTLPGRPRARRGGGLALGVFATLGVLAMSALAFYKLRGGETQRLELAAPGPSALLAPGDARAAAPDAAPAHVAEREGELPARLHAAAAPAAAPGRRVATPSAARDNRRAGGNASLRIQIHPWAEVWLDGKALGMTPLRSVEVSPGPHTLLAKHPDLGTKSMKINVAAGESRLVNLSMNPEK